MSQEIVKAFTLHQGFFADFPPTLPDEESVSQEILEALKRKDLKALTEILDRDPALLESRSETDPSPARPLSLHKADFSRDFPQNSPKHFPMRRT